MKRAPATGRRVLFLLLALALLSGVVAWLFAPDVKSLRPDIELFLKQELGLKDLKLGELSWYWAGHLGVKAAASSFATHDDAVVVRESSVTVNISLLDILFGKLTPAGVHLNGGDIEIEGGAGKKGGEAVGEAGALGALALPDMMTLQDMSLKWRYGDLHGWLEHFSASLNNQDRQLRARFPGGRIDLSFGDHRLPEAVEVEFSNLDWLPTRWRQYVVGTTSGKVQMVQRRRGHWRLTVDMASGEAKAASFLLQGAEWPFDSIVGEFNLLGDPEAETVSHIQAKSLEWKYNRNMMRVSGLWQKGTLKLSASTPYLEMPLIWQGLRPLGGSEWQDWLAGMKRGVASEAWAEVEMPWAAPWRAGPSEAEIAAFRYQVSGHVADADIGIAIHDDLLTDTEADVEIDEAGLKAKVISTRLPHAIGSASGGLHIPWDTTILNITGRGDVDAGLLHARIDEAGAESLHWGTAPAQAEFSLQWLPGEERPRGTTLTLHPQTPWALTFKDVPVRVASGAISWTMGEGVQLRDVVWSTPLLNLTTDLAAAQNDTDQWQVLSMRARAEGELESLVNYFLLPIETPGGKMVATLDFDGAWHGNLDLQAASWGNLLGTSKAAGVEQTISYAGSDVMKKGQRLFAIENIHCNDKALRLKGSGELAESGMMLNLEHIETASFTGAVAVRAPFGADPWELNIDAAYLNRNALPEALPRDLTAPEKPWALRANLERFVWGDAEINGASIQLASALNSVAVLKASSLRSGDLTMSDLSTIFSMPGEGMVDLRSFEASLNNLHLKLSATLLPAAKETVQWRGVATLEGKFGDLMRRAELSNIFEDGDLYALFSGQGELFGDQPWWQGLNGRLRMRVNDGRILQAGTLSKWLAAISLADLPDLLIGNRSDLTKPGLSYKRLQMEAVMHDKNVEVHKLAMRSSAMDVAGKGVMDIDSSHIDLTLVMRPLQNLDAILAKIPLIRDMFGGAAHSLFRKVYRMQGPIADAEVVQISPEDAGLASPGVVETLLGLPEKWFGKEAPATTK